MNFPRISFTLLALAAALSISACHSNSNQNANPQNSQNPQQPATAAPGQPGTTASNPVPPSPPPPEVVNLRAGTEIRVRLDQDLGSKISQPGDSFTATVSDDVTSSSGQVIIPKESRADGTVIDAKPLGRFKGGAMLAIRLERVQTRWGSYPVSTSTISKAEQGKGKRSVEFIGGGAGLGAIVGRLYRRGKCERLGAMAGGGAGTAG